MFGFVCFFSLSLFPSSSFWFDCLVVVETRTAKFLRGHPVCNEFGLGRFQLPRDIAYFLVKCVYNLKIKTVYFLDVVGITILDEN